MSREPARRIGLATTLNRQETFHLFLHLMATHTVSWGGTEDPISPVPSSTPSIVSIDSALSYESNTSSTVREATGPTPVAKLMDFLLVESSGSETSASTQHRADTAHESFTRHHKYFFKDGNVTFLVRGFS